MGLDQFDEMWNWIKDQRVLPSVISLLILLIFFLDDVLILLRESYCWPLSGLKGFKKETNITYLVVFIEA